MKALLLLLAALLACSASLYGQSPATAFRYYWNDGSWPAAQTLAVGPGVDIQASLALDDPELPVGFNFLHCQARNAAGIWSIPLHRLFFKHMPTEALSPVTSLEYYLDSDPGFGLGNQVDISSGAEVLQVFSMALGNADVGFHSFHLLARNAAGKWSLPLIHPVFVASLQDIPAVESVTWYFTGPGVDESSSWQDSSFPPAQEVVLNEAIPLTHLVQGQTYQMHVYATSTLGRKSQEVVSSFTVNWIPQNLAAAVLGGEVTFSWEGIIGAQFYLVQAADAPDGVFTTIGSTADTFWTEAAQTRRFLRVKAIRD